MSTIQSLTTVEVKISAYQTSQEELARRLSDSEAVATELGAKKEEFETVRNKAFASLESYRQMQLNIMNDVKNFEENQALLKAEVAERRAQVEEFKDEHNKVVGRLHGLEALTANFEGLHDGVKKVMTWQKEKHVRLHR